MQDADTARETAAPERGSREDQIVHFGEPLKLIRTFKVDGAEYATLGGYLVVFTDAENPDLTGDFFTKATDFGTLTRKGRAEVAGYYQHGFDPHFKGEAIGDAELSVTDFGVWAEYQIELRTDYERHLVDMARKGLMGQSSGAVGHLVERKAVTGEVYEITRWPIGEASLTPTPAEPKTSAMPLKAFREWAERQTPVDLAAKMSLTAHVNRIADAFYRRFGDGPTWAWVAEVFDDHVIAEFGETYYSVPYTDGPDGVTFAGQAEWREVERRTEWVAKSAEAKARAEADRAARATTDTPEAEEAPATKEHQTAPQGAEPMADATQTAEAVETPDTTPEAKAETVTLSREDLNLLIKTEARAQVEDTKPEAKALYNTEPAPAARKGAPAFIKETGDSADQALAAWIKGDEGAMKSHLIGTNEIAIKASNATDMNVGTDADGGYAVPTGHFGEIIARRDELALDARLGVRVVPGVGTTINVPIDAEDDGEFVTTAEAGTYDRDAPALGQKQFTLVKKTKEVLLSEELMEDEASRLMPFIEDFVGRGMAKTKNAMLVAEVAASGTNFLTLAGTAAIADGELETIEGNDNLAAYLEDTNVGWVLRNSTLANIRKISGSERIYAAMSDEERSVRAGRQLIGYPVARSNAVAALGAGNKPILFGNWGYVGRYEAPVMTVFRDPYTYRKNGQTALYYGFRLDYGVLQAEAIGFATNAAS